MKEITIRDFPKEVRDIIEEKDILAFKVKNIGKNIIGFTKYDFVFVNAEKDFYTQRFALCHELGHNVLKHRFGDNQEEKEADIFACNLLLDEKELKEKVEEGWMLSDLEITFGIPQCEILKKIKQIYKPEKLNFYF